MGSCHGSKILYLVKQRRSKFIGDEEKALDIKLRLGPFLKPNGFNYSLNIDFVNLYIHLVFTGQHLNARSIHSS